jgi:hypothetical protein
MVVCWVLLTPPPLIWMALVIGSIVHDPVNTRRQAEQAWTAHRRW